MEIHYQDAIEKLTVKIGQLERDHWSIYMHQLDELEQYFIVCGHMELDMYCGALDNSSTLFMMHVLKMAERYQWLGEKKIEVRCHLEGTEQPESNWLKEKLEKCFELDIRFPVLLAGSTLL